ncbi:MAG: type II toxin-antitoxin system RelE/ParE family toxin [Bradyrhizobium sp.]|jgi:addiction module RelE/StbE family toxin
MKLRWSETALAEIDSIFSYISENNRSAAAAVVERIEGLATLLAEFPFVGHLTDEAPVRVLRVVRYPFLIFYTIDDATDEIMVLHVRHAAQERP